jgi:beta-galactosidase beta subunit
LAVDPATNDENEQTDAQNEQSNRYFEIHVVGHGREPISQQAQTDQGVG